MQHFVRPAGLERLSLEARIIYTGFAIFMVAGYASSVWLYWDSALGVRPASAQRYYLGEPAWTDEQARPAGGPVLALPEPDSVAGSEMHFEKAPRQVIETVHFHLFAAAVCLVVIAHLFMMCRISRHLKISTLLVGTAATLLHVVAPALVRFLSSSLAFLVFPSAIVMAVTWLVMTFWPICEMWTLPRNGSPATGGEPGRASAPDPGSSS